MKYALAAVLLFSGVYIVSISTYLNNEIPISDYSVLLNHPFCVETMPFVQECLKDDIISRVELTRIMEKDKENKDLINKQAFIDEVKAR